jgi:hypothetical protein
LVRGFCLIASQQTYNMWVHNMVALRELCWIVNNIHSFMLLTMAVLILHQARLR